MKYISTNIKVLRKEARLSFDELSEETGISVENLKLFEKGKLVPNEFEIRALCKPLRIHYEDIIERDILSERTDAGRRMRHSSDRNNYNWYLGDRKIMGIYIGYVVVVLLMFICFTLFSKFTNFSLLLRIDPETGKLLPVSLMDAAITGYFLTSYISGISFIVWLLIKIKYQFRFWHLFLISMAGGFATIIGLVPLVGAIVMLPSLGYSFYRIIKGGKK